MSYAKGKYAKFISDRSGLEFPYTEMAIEWNGMRVHTSEYEPKAPQLMPHEHTPDPQALEHARPARVEPATERLLPLNAFKYPVGETVIKINEPGHSRTTGDTVRFRDAVGIDSVILNQVNSATGQTITIINDDFYSFSVGVAPTRTTIFGGGVASAGPVTLSS